MIKHDFLNILQKLQISERIQKKILKSKFSPFIAALINKSISSGTFPSQLKSAKVFPVFKGGAKSDPSNYRPISILPTVSKLFEKHVNKHLMNYLNKHKIIHESQSGFRQKHSCQTALVKLLDQWMAWLRDGSLQNQFLPGRFLRDISLKISNGTVRSKVVGRFAQKQIYGSIHPFS